MMLLLRRTPHRLYLFSAFIEAYCKVQTNNHRMKILVAFISLILIGQLAQSQFIIKDSTIVGFDKFILGTPTLVFEKQLKPVVYKNDAKTKRENVSIFLPKK